AKEALYEVTGMGDIIRGASNASETATAQQLKSQWGSLRIRDRQRDIQRFARDLIRKKAAVISEHFTQETLAAMSGVNLLTALQKQQIMQYMQAGQQFMQAQQQAAQMGAPPPMVPGILQAMPQPTPEQVKMLAEPTWDDVIALLRNDKLRGFSIDIETDSTIEPDQQAEQQKATEFLVSVTQYLTACLPIVQAAPQAASMLGELLLFGARRFKISETVETSIEKFTATMQAQAQQPPMPNPKIAADAEKAQSDIEVAKIGAQAAGVKAQAETTKAQIGIQQTMAEHETTMLEKRADMAIRQAAPNPALAGLI
ncbi:MAG: hypothetical protein JHC46_05675, partial [Solirubrobacteraceae bacterium]|nr:hypothetical protein [Solirubrobacteraceae bacterium]